MTDAFISPKKLVIFGILVPLAALLGYLLAEGDSESLSIAALLVVPLLIPVFLRWHHILLVFSWNLSVILFFLPGTPPVWMLAGWISFGVTILSRIMDKNRQLLGAPAVTWSLILIALVVVFTMKATGSIGIRSLGGASHGGKKYIFILFAIVAYFGLSTLKISRQNARSYLAAYFLPGISTFLSNVIFTLGLKLGPVLWLLFNFVSAEGAYGQAVDEFSLDPYGTRFGRITGLSFASVAATCYMLARFGVRGILDPTKPWRFGFLLLTVVASLFGGFRSIILLNGMLFMAQFFMEGLHKTRLLPLLLASGLVTILAVIPFAQKLPLSAQRALSFLPIEINSAARADAQGSIDWRLDMWKVLWQEVPKYFWIGKGYTASATEYYLVNESVKRGLGTDFDLQITAGDYHSGLLSILIPFGIFGVLAFVVFIWAGLNVLINNYRHGPTELRLINSFLLSCFAVRVFFFFAIYGSIHSDLLTLVGLVGFGIALNGGVCRQQSGEIQQSPKTEIALT